MTQTTATSLEVVQGMYEAFAQGDVDAVMRALDDGIEWYEAEGNPWDPGHALVGPQQVLEGVFARIPESFEDFRIESRRFLRDGDTVVVEARYRSSRHRTTGKPLDVQVAHIWDVRNGKVVRFQQYVDTRRIADVMGVSDY
ncbi:nuclear transport factor 2 family protein [Geodermatophilus sp. SYSU D01186]